MRLLINGLIEMIDARVGNFTHIVGLESKGFVLGGILAWHYKLPFVPIRKKGKLPGECFRQEYSLEYGKDTVEIQKSALPVGSKVILLDDLLATGGTLAAGEALIGNIEGVEVVANVVIWEIDFFKGRDKLSKPTYSIIHLE